MITLGIILGILGLLVIITIIGGVSFVIVFGDLILGCLGIYLLVRVFARN